MPQNKRYEEHMNHNTKELPIALHQLSYPEGTDILFYLHWHKEFEFLVVTGGSIELWIDDVNYALHTGDCAFINSNSYHTAKAHQQNACSFFAVDFTYEFLNENFYSHFSRDYIQPILDRKLTFPSHITSYDCPSTDWRKKVLTLLTDINSYGEEELGSYELMAKSRIYTVWELFYTHAKHLKKENEQSTARQERLKPVIEYIHQNFGEEITLKELADILPMSEGQFCRIFKETMKVTPFQYIIRIRILKSCTFLMDTDKKIWEIANLCGFNNISYYNKVFSQMIGCTPKQYRMSM